MTREVMDGFTANHPELELLVLGNEKGGWMNKFIQATSNMIKQGLVQGGNEIA